MDYIYIAMYQNGFDREPSSHELRPLRGNEEIYRRPLYDLDGGPNFIPPDYIIYVAM